MQAMSACSECMQPGDAFFKIVGHEIDAKKRSANHRYTLVVHAYILWKSNGEARLWSDQDENPDGSNPT